LNYESRLQVIHFLFGIAKADGNVSVSEINKLLEFSNLLRLSHADFQSIKAMFINEVGGAYKILEIEKSATDNQVKKAYRDLAKKHHPDKVQHLGDAYAKAAQEKFQKVQKAYERIKQERGF
jgi:DnaJ like chaperone protein